MKSKKIAFTGIPVIHKLKLKNEKGICK